MKCLDTTFFVDLVRRPSRVSGVAEEIDTEGRVATTVFNVFEAYLGAFAVRDEKIAAKIRDKLNKAFNRVEILDFTYRDALRASEIGGELLKKGFSIGADSITAAVALNNGCEAVVTRNVKHFKPVNELVGLGVVEY
jgi:predicted nucleic acid-binding protein